MFCRTRSTRLVALPSGLEPLEEVAEVIIWRQLEYHSRIVVLLNADGFYSGLWIFIDGGWAHCELD